jgi:hypothetical protein
VNEQERTCASAPDGSSILGALSPKGRIENGTLAFQNLFSASPSSHKFFVMFAL